MAECPTVQWLPGAKCKSLSVSAQILFLHQNLDAWTHCNNFKKLVCTFGGGGGGKDCCQGAGASVDHDQQMAIH